MICNQCQRENREIAKFCRYCGAPVETAVDAGGDVSSGDPILGGLAGLDEIRQELNGYLNVVKGMMKDGNTVRMNYNLIIYGNSGTAKSLLGDLFFRALKKTGYLKREQPHPIEAGDFISFDNEAVAKAINNAKGGMLIIDNAQDLFQNGQPVGSLKRLLVEMDAGKGDPIILLTGLPSGLREFVSRPENANFTGRFRRIFPIDDYDHNTLHAIIKQNLAVKYGFDLADGADEKLEKRCRFLVKEMKNPESNLGAANGYLGVRECDALVHAYYTRGGTEKKISPEDITGEILEKKSAEEIMARFEQFIGMEKIKADIRSMYNRLALAEENGEEAELNLHSVITGNPGTGKTTVVRVLGDIYSALGVLETGHVVEVDRGKLVAAYQGQTAIQVNKAVDNALGGILFVDEAYALKQGENDSFGQEAIDTLLKRVEDDRGKFCCIVAGYKKEMADFMATNPGLTSRFPKTFELEDYTADELYRMFLLNMEQAGYTADEGAHDKIRKFFEERVARKTKDFANGREARNLFEGAKGLLSTRLSKRKEEGKQIDGGAGKCFLAEDIPTLRQEGGVSLEEAMGRLNALTGLKAVKDKVQELADKLEGDRLMGQVKPLAEHFSFIGNPGTGKTTVARIFADVLFATGLIPSNTLIETDRSGMVANYSGQTAPKVNDIVDKAMGGVLFIDEAYNLIQGEGDSFGMEAINTLLKRLEDDRGKFICIVAGYKKEMHDFIQSNSGLKSRFTTTIDFEDYDADEMARIFNSLTEKEGYTLTDEAREAARKLFESMVARKTKDFGNARDVRKVFETTRGKLSGRIVAMKREGADEDTLKRLITVIEKEDLPLDKGGTAELKEKALAKLDKQIGLGSVKNKVRELLDILEAQKLRGREKALGVHFVFTGNPGTGKTTVARILADIFYAIGLIPSNTLIEADRSEMVAGYVGQTAIKTNRLIDRAMGGVLFVDEAYTLSQGQNDSFGPEAIDTLLKRMEDDRGKFILIAAGYEKEMDQFLNTNTGLKSRFSDYIHFEDYTGPEMTDIFALFAKMDGFTLEENALGPLKTYFEKVYENRDANFGNGRTVRQFFDKAVGNQSRRLLEIKSQGLTGDELTRASNTITLADLGL